MLVLKGRNVNELWPLGFELLRSEGVPEQSRAGAVLVAPCPVTSVYERPTERVLFCPLRDANPFFHLFEALWMLAGRDDAKFLNRFVKDFGARFAQPDGRIHGAYGARWRDAFGFDQLEAIVEKLKANPQDRQAVLQMWSCDRGYADLTASGLLDRPCNTHVYFRVRDGERGLIDTGRGDRVDHDSQVLDLTVCCRSNDIVWGAYGANAVHFSFLQEYMAGQIGVQVGTMYQVSNNFHGYLPVLDKISGASYSDVENLRMRVPYPQTMSIGLHWDSWDSDLEEFLSWTDVPEPDQEPHTYPRNPWFQHVAEPMYVAHHFWRKGERELALEIMTLLVQAADWRRAGIEWMQRRMK